MRSWQAYKQQVCDEATRLVAGLSDLPMTEYGAIAARQCRYLLASIQIDLCSPGVPKEDPEMRVTIDEGMVYLMRLEAKMDLLSFFDEYSAMDAR